VGPSEGLRVFVGRGGARSVTPRLADPDGGTRLRLSLTRWRRRISNFSTKADALSARDRVAVKVDRPLPFSTEVRRLAMELSDHTTITILRAAWVIDVAAVLVLHWTALALLRYGDAHPSALGPGADDLPAPQSRFWMWRTAGGGRLLRFAWSADAIRAQDSTVRRHVRVLRVASAVIAATLMAMLLVTARHPSRHWNLVQTEQRRAPQRGHLPPAATRPLVLSIG
jgi:hypothetical protein